MRPSSLSCFQEPSTTSQNPMGSVVNDRAYRMPKWSASCTVSFSTPFTTDLSIPLLCPSTDLLQASLRPLLHFRDFILHLLFVGNISHHWERTSLKYVPQHTADPEQYHRMDKWANKWHQSPTTCLSLGPNSHCWVCTSQLVRDSGRGRRPTVSLGPCSY